MIFEIGVSSGRATCPLCGSVIEKGLPTLTANLGSGKYPKTYHLNPTHFIKHDSFKNRDVNQICKGFLKTYEETLTELPPYKNLKAGFDMLMEYWDSLPDDEKPELDEKLRGLGL